MDALTDLTIAEASALIAARRLSPVEYLDAHLARIKAIDPTLNAFIRVIEDESRENARHAEAEIVAKGPRSKLHGIPIGLKDIIDLAGHPTTCHSRLCQDNVAAEDAHVVRLLREAGAIFPGKLATHEFAIGGPAFDGPFPPARNPWNPACHPGGSSSGPAVAVASRMLPAAIGTDTGGSIRHPASHCGIVGLKPTYGLVSRRGVFPLSFSLDHVGPMTRTVLDCALLLSVIAAHDPDDRSNVGTPRDDYPRDLHIGVRGMKIGFVRHFHERDIVADERMGAAVMAAADLLEAEGATVREVTLPPLQDFRGVNRILVGVESAAVHAKWLRTEPGAYAGVTRRRLLPGMFLSGVDYVQAQRRRTVLVEEVASVFNEVDLLLTASGMEPACAIDDEAEIERTFATRNARFPFNLTGHPAITLMCGLAEPEHLPLAFQLVAKPFAEATLLRAAAAYERASGWSELQPFLTKAQSETTSEAPRVSA